MGSLTTAIDKITPLPLMGECIDRRHRLQAFGDMGNRVILYGERLGGGSPCLGWRPVPCL